MKRDRLGIIVICLSYALAGAFLWQSSNPLKTAETPRVAGVNKARFQETPGLPSPNQVLALVNTERQKAQLLPLQVNPKLEEIAQARAEDMQNNNYYAHQAKNGLFYYDLLKTEGLNSTYSCENLDLSFMAEPKQYIVDWLGSHSHKKCLLHTDSSQAGYAVAKLALPNNNGSDSYVIVAIHTGKLTE